MSKHVSLEPEQNTAPVLASVKGDDLAMHLDRMLDEPRLQLIALVAFGASIGPTFLMDELNVTLKPVHTVKTLLAGIAKKEGLVVLGVANDLTGFSLDKLDGDLIFLL